MLFEELDEILNASLGCVDWWSDHAMDDCIRTVSGFQEHDWAVLQQTMPVRLTECQCRLLDILG